MSHVDKIGKLIGSGIAAVGVIGAFAGVLSTPPNIRDWAAPLLAATIIVVLILIFASIFKERSKNNIGVNPNFADVAFVVQSADEHDIRWIADLQKSIYAKEDAVPIGVLLEWYRVFPNGFFIIRDHLGNAVGHLDILPIKPETFKKFKDGEISETEIRGECLYTPEEKNNITDIYIESLIISIPQKSLRGLVLREVIRSVPYIIDQVGDKIAIQRISAMAATKDGEKLLRHLGFQLISRANERKDRHNMFEAKFQIFFERVLGVYHRNSSVTTPIGIEHGL